MDNNTQHKIHDRRQNVDADITLRDIVLKASEWASYLKNKWFIVLISICLGGVLGLGYALKQKTNYKAALTFVLEEEKSSSSGLAGALGLASSLGLDFGGGAGGAFSSANIIGLMKSRSLIQKTLLQPVQIKGRSISLAQYFIEINQMNKDWARDPRLTGLQFSPFADPAKFTLVQDSVMSILYDQIAGEKGLLTVGQKDKKVSIITVEVISVNEYFSKLFAESIAKVVSDFYIETKSKKARLNYEILQGQADSVRNELNAAITGVAISSDNTYNLNPAFNIKRTPSTKRQIDVQANTAILTQLVTNLEMAKVTLRRETPLIQIIDAPVLPLIKIKIGKLRAIIFGATLFAFLSSIIIISKQTKVHISPENVTD